MPRIEQKLDTRRVFIDTLCDLAEKDERVVLIVPDVGFNYIEKFKENFPTRFFNTGVTEQSTMILASGLALSGMRPFVYSMINFVLFRPAEMVRNAIVCHKAPVVLLGVKGSSSYRFLGFSHNLLHNKEDKNFCKNIGLRYMCPNSNSAVKKAVLSAYKQGSPCYIRL